LLNILNFRSWGTSHCGKFDRLACASPVPVNRGAMASEWTIQKMLSACFKLVWGCHVRFCSHWLSQSKKLLEQGVSSRPSKTNWLAFLSVAWKYAK
jgi:hypothetical protein